MLRPALAVFVLSVVVRLAFVAAGPGWHVAAKDLDGDAPQFHRLAVTLSEGEGYSVRWPGPGPHHGQRVPTAIRAPLWPITLSTLYRAVGVSPFGGRLLVVFVDALTCALLVPLGALLAWRSAGVAAGALAAVYPPLWAHVATLWSEPLFTLLVVLVVLAAALHRRAPSPFWALVVGLLAGLATLARPNGFFVAGAMIAWVAWSALARGDRWRALALATACLAGVAAGVAPWEVRNARQLHTFVPVTTLGGSVIAGDYSAATARLDSPVWGWWDVQTQVADLLSSRDEPSFDDEMWRRGWTWIRDHPRESAGIVGLHVVRYFDLYWSRQNRILLRAPTRYAAVNAAAVVAWWAAAASAVLGLVRLWRRRATRSLAPWAPALAAWAALAASGVFLAALTRYRVPSDPVVLLLAGTALTRPPGRHSRRV